MYFLLFVEPVEPVVTAPSCVKPVVGVGEIASVDETTVLEDSKSEVEIMVEEETGVVSVPNAWVLVCHGLFNADDGTK